MILVGSRQGDCQMQLIDFEQQATSPCDSSSCDCSSFAQSPFIYANSLRKALERHSKVWNAVQQRKKKGKASVEWVMPIVRVLAWFPSVRQPVHICTTIDTINRTVAGGHALTGAKRTYQIL